jgi:hypothetical protein
MPSSERAELSVSEAQKLSGGEVATVMKVVPPALADTRGTELLERPSLKRKEVEPSSSNRFKVVSQLVIAMKRFQGV